jgi:hypothetical protein|uniref:PolyVal ADP-Ribosyltransferase n=1 Tax=Myoviridae sp. ctshb19 TaxID=2825194 RepID=A0A8S5UGT4_9CAUD|nr:MAG TPA: PolyVal ADP-Ribosyltransferase [Myoviridae sp. ctshb19]
MEMILSLATAKQQMTPEFKRWFRNSKCVDHHGNPLRVYHGSPNTNFRAFLTGLNKAKNEAGIFFAADPKMASLYSGYDENWPAPVVGHVMPCYLSIQKLYAHDFEGGKEGRDIVINEALRHGCDGVHLKNHYDAGGVGDQWIVFSPKQIKSAMGNNGQFGESDNIDE